MLPGQEQELSEVLAAEGIQGHVQLFVSLYEELHRVARRELRRGGPAFTLGASTLLHEMYLTLHERQDIAFPDRVRFLAYASRAMRGLIVDYVRRKKSLKRGGNFEITSLPTEPPDQPICVELQRLGDAVERLFTFNPRLAELVDLKYFAGFSFVDIAKMWGLSERTVQRDWEKARLFLHQCMCEDGEGDA